MKLGNIQLLDCTLRDGGYVNDWSFGEKNIRSIIQHLESAGVDILELGFIRDEPYCPDRSIYPSAEAITRLRDKKSVVYSAMIEAFNPFPLEKLSCRHENDIDLIRICIWKRCMKEHMDYCDEVRKKGYRITIQPSRVEQYSDDEFVDMLKRSNDLRPDAVYVVDTWGTQFSHQICHYVELADRWLSPEIKIGYHGHNNQLQALACVDAIMHMNLKRDICIDSCIMGMGRGAGNLNTEVIMAYFNQTRKADYAVKEILEAYYQCIEPIYRQKPWGYSVFYYISSILGSNPDYATYFSNAGYSPRKFQIFLDSLSESEKIVFHPGFTEKRIKELLETEM